ERFHSEEARPYGYVKVLSVRGGFLGLWNDNRSGGAGLYMRKVLLDGTLMGSEVRIGEAIVQDSSFTIAMIGGEDERMTLVMRCWDGIYMGEISTSLAGLQRNRRIGSELRDFYRVPGLDSM